MSQKGTVREIREVLNAFKIGEDFFLKKNIPKVFFLLQSEVLAVKQGRASW